MSLITVAVYKEWLQIDWDTENTVLGIIAEGIEDYLSEILGIRFIESGGDATITDDVDGGDVFLRPKHHPITALNSIADRNADNQAYDITEVKFNERGIWQEGEIRWDKGSERWRVSIDAGYTAASLPSGLKMGMLDAAFRWYNARGGRKSESFEGVRVSWAEFFSSDVMAKLSAYDFKGMVG